MKYVMDLFTVICFIFVVFTFLTSRVIILEFSITEMAELMAAIWVIMRLSNSIFKKLKTLNWIMK